MAAEEGLSGQLVSQSEGSVGCQGNVAQFESQELLSLDSEGRAVITQHEIEYVAEIGWFCVGFFMYIVQDFFFHVGDQVILSKESQVPQSRATWLTD